LCISAIADIMIDGDFVVNLGLLMLDVIDDSMAVSLV